MLVKLAIMNNFTNILLATFAQIFLRQKRTPEMKVQKSCAQNFYTKTRVRKLFVILKQGGGVQGFCDDNTQTLLIIIMNNSNLCREMVWNTIFHCNRIQVNLFCK